MSSTTTQPAPADVSTARGVLIKLDGEQMVMLLPGTEYHLFLHATRPPNAEVGKRVAGTIRAQARRVDTVRTGGQYIEPVMGRPRRVQGTVRAVLPSEQSITVNAGVPIVCRLTDARQKAEHFKTGDLVSFDVLPGATFTPTA